MAQVTLTTFGQTVTYDEVTEISVDGVRMTPEWFSFFHRHLGDAPRIYRATRRDDTIMLEDLTNEVNDVR